jgi:hypothetical protein
MRTFLASLLVSKFDEGTSMKLLLAALALPLAISTVMLAQEGKVIEPQYSSAFYYLRPSGEAVELERQTPNTIPKGSKVLFVIPGGKSPVRLSAADEMQFVVRVEEDFDRATATLQLFRFEGLNGVRQLELKKEDVTKNKATLKLNAERYGNSSLKVVPSQKLAPGEYCLSRSTIAQGFCFGVDTAGNQ